MVEKKTGIYESIQYFNRIKNRTYQLLGYLGYNREDTLKAGQGNWEIYTKRDFSFPFFNPEFSCPVNKFVALYKSGEKELPVYGSFERSLDDLKNSLRELTAMAITPPTKILGIPLSLTEENAQDYGYKRGVIAGILVILADFLFSLIFKLRSGVITGFIDYIKLVYYGNPELGITIGIAGTGLYFGVLLILLPISYGSICIWKAKKLQIRKSGEFNDRFPDYEFGIKAENCLGEELATIIEEKKKAAMYKELCRLETGLTKSAFEDLYAEIRKIVLAPEQLYRYMRHFNGYTRGRLLFQKFIEIIARYDKTDVETELRVKPANFS